jgi:hypothetical protein
LDEVVTAKARPPWYAVSATAGVVCILVGIYWDISWHMSIGRDSFWTPAHVAIQLGGIIGGLTGAALIFATTFRRNAALRPASVRVWGFRGPLGAFVAAWGAAAMIISAPFDNWWHGAYGLDVKILSPPHMVLSLGITGVASGAAILLVSAANRSSGAAKRWLEWMVLVVGGGVLSLGMMMILELTFSVNMHRAQCYFAVALTAPLVLHGFGQLSDSRWSTTAIATVYTAFMAAMVWLFPLFPAEAKLGPVYQPITHFVPLQFPVLIIVPAIAVDLMRPRLRSWRRHNQALVLGVAFVPVLLAVQWPFAEFLTSSASANWVFGTHYHAYMEHPSSYGVTGTFIPQATGDLVAGLARSVVAAVITTWLGMTVGGALRRVRR